MIVFAEDKGYLFGELLLEVNITFLIGRKVFWWTGFLIIFRLFFPRPLKQ
jgi:hypothetical protein